MYRRCPSIQKIDLDRLDNLAKVVEHLRQTMEQEIIGMSKDVNCLLQNTEANYSEYYVRTATQDAASLLREIEMLARRLDDQMREKVSGLKYAVSQYAQTDKQVEKLAQTQPSSSLFNHKSPFLAAQWSDITGNSLYGPAKSTTSEPFPFPNFFEQLEAFQRQGIMDRLAPFQEDSRIAALLQTMQNQDAFAQKLAQAELTKIAEAFTEIARSQKAYVVYQAYGQREYMESAHQYAEAQRKKLEEMGVSDEWYKEGIDLSDFYQGGFLKACRYNPLKNDRSLLLDDEEIRALLEQGMLGEVELDVLRQKYDELEVKVLHRLQLEQQLEEYNRLVAEEDIRKMQQLLKDMNLYHGEITGKYEQELLIAIAGYQYIANNHSTMFAVWRELSGYHDGKEFEVDGLITKELLELANAERGLGYWNDPNVKASGLGVALTSVGVGDGIVSQIWDEGSGLLKQAWSVNPTNPKFWTETVPGYYDLAKAITNGDITLEDIKEALKEGATEEFVVPFQDIWDLQGKILSGKASYEESERYGRALVKAFLALTLVEGAVKSGVKISGKLSKQLSELLPKLNGGAVAVTEGGTRFRIPDGYHIDTPDLPKTDTQRQFIEFQRQQEPRGNAGGTGNGGRIISSVDDLPDVTKSKITTSQRATLNQQERTYSHLTEMDLKGAQRDLDGNPVPKPGGGFYDHVQEVSDAYRGLVDLKRSWEGVLKNPNLDTELRQLYTSKLNEINATMKKIEDMFAPHGGVYPPK
ncbi:polymorphic toxin type 28 domain-containing protein [Paenibacillus lutimineralis]|uniref:polymorphic toxin type 28 domain-containing protein n=1 Tax=Paenibacillus lutimineralis TaxID=2707005 RepID=UPI001D0401F4|nr:polymorphic toxin type 28 domain-containing protein [Paenibacillus lutimineralis]